MKPKLMLLAAGPEQVPLIMAAKQRGVYTIVVDEDPTRPGMRLADKPAVMSIMDEAGCIDLARTEKIDGVAATALSLGMRTVGAIAEELGLPGLRRDSAYLTTDKIAMRQRMAEVGLPSAAFRIVKDSASAARAVNELGLPVIIKPPDGSGKRGIRLIEDHANVPAAYQTAAESIRAPDRAGQVLVERFVDGRDFGSEGFIVSDDLALISIREMLLTPRPYRQEIGYDSPAKILPDEKDLILSYLRDVAVALGLRNTAFHADFKLDKRGQPVLIEMGARMPGYGLSCNFVPHATGIKPFPYVIDLALGRHVHIPEPQCNPTVMRFLQIRPGQLRRIGNLEELADFPGIVHVHSNLKPGDIIMPVTDGISAMKVGYVVTTGKTISEARHRANEAVLHLQMEPGRMDHKQIFSSTRETWSRIIDNSNLRWPDEDVARAVNRFFGDKSPSERSEMKVLDIGFGTGRHVVYLFLEGFSVYGIDYTQDAMTSTRERLAEMELTADLRLEELSETTFEANSFDFVLAWGVVFLKPMEQIRKDFAKVYNLLKPGGVLCVNFRTLNNWFYGLGEPHGQHGFLLDERAGPYRGGFYRFFSKEEVEALLTNVGFQIIHLEYKEWHKFGEEVHSWWLVSARTPA